jgi:hypothetical protein
MADDKMKWLRNAIDQVNRTREVTVVQKPKRGSFVRGTFIGAALGAVAGLLLAPKLGVKSNAKVWN